MLVFASGCSSFSGWKPGERIQSKQYFIDKLWARALTDKNTGFRRSHRMEPIVLKGVVIQGNGYDGITAFSRKAGREIWSFPVKDGVEGGADVDKTSLYFGGGDGNFYSLDLKTGKVNWKFPLTSQVLAQPRVHKELVYFLSGNNTLYALHKRTGEQAWLYRRAPTTNLSIRGGSRPIIQRDVLYVGMSDGYFVAVDVVDGSLKWERPLLDRGRFIDVDSGAVIQDSRIYVASYDGSLFCLSQSDGQVIWTLGKGAATGVTIHKDSLYYSTSLGEVLAIDKKSGQVKWDYRVPSGIGTLPKYHKGLLIFGESGGPLRVVAARTGKEVALFDTGRGVSGAPHVSRNGDIFFISNQGYLYGIRISRREKERVWH